MSPPPTPDRGHLVRIPSILPAIPFGTPDKEGIKASFEEWISLKTRPYQLDLIGRAPFQPESFLLNFSVTEFQSSSLHLPSIPK